MDRLACVTERVLSAVVVAVKGSSRCLPGEAGL